MAENVVTRYDPHFHLGMRVMTLIWCFRGWQVCGNSMLATCNHFQNGGFSNWGQLSMVVLSFYQNKELWFLNQ